MALGAHLSFQTDGFWVLWALRGLGFRIYGSGIARLRVLGLGSKVIARGLWVYDLGSKQG